MSVVIKLQNLPITASSLDIRQFFHNLNIPEGGVHIGPEGDAFITFSTDEDARLAMKLSGSCLKDSVIYLSLSSRNEMAEVIEAAHKKAISMLNNASRSSSAVPLPPHTFINRSLWLSLANPHYSLTNENSDMNGVNSRNMTHFVQNNIVDESMSKPRTQQQQQQPVSDSISSSNTNHENSNNSNWSSSSSLDFLLEMTTDPKKCVLITGIPSMDISEKNVVDFFSDTGLIPFDTFIFKDGKILCKFADSKKSFRAVMMKNGTKFQEHHCEIVSVMLYQPAIHSYLLKQLNNKNEQVVDNDTKSLQYQPQQHLQHLQHPQQQQQQNNFKSEPFEFKAKTLSDSNNNNHRPISPNFKYRKQKRMYRLPFNKSNQQLKSSHGVPLLLQNRPPLLGLAPRPLLMNPQQQPQNSSHGHQSVVSLSNFLIGNNNNHNNTNFLLGTSSPSSFSVPNTLHSNYNNINGTSIINPISNCRNPFALSLQQLQSPINIPNSSSSSASSSSASDQDDRSNSNNNNNNINSAPQATAEQVARFSKPGCVLAMENFPIQARMDDILHFLKETLELDITRNRIIRRFDEKSHPTGDIRLAFDTPFEAQLAQKRLHGVYMYNNFIRCSILTNF